MNETEIVPSLNLKICKTIDPQPVDISFDKNLNKKRLVRDIKIPDNLADLNKIIRPKK